MAGCILLAAGNAAGCGAGQTAAAAGNGGGQTTAPETGPAEETAAERTVVFTDDLGRTVEVPYQPQRVAALIGSFADIWCLAGGKNSLAAAADDTWTQFDLGLSDEVMRRADYALSFSRMTFPHQLMRVVLLEQIYRGFRILNGEPYHK